MENRTAFMRDFEVIVTNTDFINNGTIRFVFNHMDRVQGAIDNLNIGQRAYNALRRGKIHDIPTLVSRMDGFNGVRGAGKKTIKEIKNEFLNYYYDQLNEEERKQFWRDTYEATFELATTKAPTIDLNEQTKAK